MTQKTKGFCCEMHGGREVGKRMERYIGKEVKQAINTNHWVRTSSGSFSSSGPVAEILLSSCSRPSSLSEEVVPHESYITHTHTHTRHPIPRKIWVFFDGLFVSGLSGPVTNALERWWLEDYFPCEIVWNGLFSGDICTHLQYPTIKDLIIINILWVHTKIKDINYYSVSARGNRERRRKEGESGLADMAKYPK